MLMSIAIFVVYAAHISIWVLLLAQLKVISCTQKLEKKSLHIIRYSLLNTKITSFLYIHDKATIDFHFQYDILEQEHAL